MKQLVALVTGASSGIGEATAIALQKNGYQVYAGARRVERMEHLKELGVKIVKLDVTYDASMVSAIKKIESESGMVDVLINNAGYGSYGALEDVPISEARRQIEVNVFGLARLTQLVIPKMRKSKQGAIINISSIGGRLGESFGTWYHTTKYAVEGFSDSLALELKPFGIRVVVVEPGAIKTEWASIAADNLVKTSGDGAYSKQAKKKAASMGRLYQTRLGSPPEVVANGIVKILSNKNPKLRYPIGGGAKPLMFLRNITSDRVFYKIFGRILG